MFMIILPAGVIFLELDKAVTKQLLSNFLNWIKQFTTSYQEI